MKNLALKIGALTLVLTMVTATLVSGTYSKYTAVSTGSDTVRVAKFGFTLKDGTNTLTTQTTNGTFNIFDYADTGVYNNGTNGTGAGSRFIAPGTSGSFEMELQNLSEVNVSATFAINESQANTPSGATAIPIYYTLNGGSDKYSKTLTGAGYKTLAQLASDMAALTGSSLAGGDGTVANGPKTTYTIGWTWDFSADAAQDTNDTKLGTATTAPTITLQIATTVTQVD